MSISFLFPLDISCSWYDIILPVLGFVDDLPLNKYTEIQYWYNSLHATKLVLPQISIDLQQIQ